MPNDLQQTQRNHIVRYIESNNAGEAKTSAQNVLGKRPSGKRYAVVQRRFEIIMRFVMAVV
jgi:hypothetical protein